MVESQGLRKKESRDQSRAVESWKRVWSRGSRAGAFLALDARHGLRPIIHLPDFEIWIILPPNPMPPPIHIMPQQTCADLAEAIELRYIFNANNGVGHDWRVE
jgi:hypothetical protein